MNKKQVIRINEDKLKQVVMETVKRILKESEEEMFVNWDDVVGYWNYDGDFVERNRERSDKLNIPYDCRCELCQKGLKDKYKTLYWKAPSEEEFNDGGSSSRFYLKNIPGTKPSKIGNTCYKSFVKAFKDKYGVNI